MVGYLSYLKSKMTISEAKLNAAKIVLKLKKQIAECNTEIKVLKAKKKYFEDLIKKISQKYK